MEYLGKHTCLSYIIDRPEVWSKIPYLKENDGRAPPFVIVVGDRRRVGKVAERLSSPVFLDEQAARISSEIDSWEHSPLTKPEYGRIAMALGTFRSVPLLVAEIQMGSFAAQIILGEILSDNLISREYRVGQEKFDASSKYVIRVGTCGGINSPNREYIREGDIVNSTFAIGVSNAVLQSTIQLDTWRMDDLESLRRTWKSLGPEFSVTQDGHPRVECAPDIVAAINKAADLIGIERCFKGGAVTKDSLYAELSEEMFTDLCLQYDARSTEDALSTIGVVCKKKRAEFGMVAGVIGLIPGSSFVESEPVKSQAEDNAISVALEAMCAVAGV